MAITYKYAAAVKDANSGKRYRVYIDRRGRPRIFNHKNHHSHLTGAEIKKVREWAKRKGYVLTVVRLDPYPFVIGDRDCNASLLRKLNSVGKFLGKKVRIRSGRRTLSEQTALYNRYKNGQGPLAAYPNANAPHIRGVAADCEIDGRDIGDYPGAVRALDRFGLGLPIPGEDWHVEETESMVGARS